MAKKKQVKRTVKVKNKLLSYFGGKFVSVTLKESALLGGSPIVKNVLLDMDDNFYYLGENIEVQFAVPIHTVMMISDGDLRFLADDGSDDKKPFGEPFQ